MSVSSYTFFFIYDKGKSANEPSGTPLARAYPEANRRVFLPSPGWYANPSQSHALLA